MKIKILFMTCVLVVLLFNYEVSAAEVSENKISGQCGDDAYYEICNEVLTISGTGVIWNSNKLNWETEKFTEVIINEGITEIGLIAFYNHDEIKNVKFPSSLRIIGQSAFYGCDGLEEVYIPEGVVYIQKNGFNFCDKLKILHLPRSLMYLGVHSFDNNKIEEIYYAGSKMRWDNINWADFSFDKKTIINYALSNNYDTMFLGNIIMIKGQGLDITDYFQYLNDYNYYNTIGGSWYYPSSTYYGLVQDYTDYGKCLKSRLTFIIAKKAHPKMILIKVFRNNTVNDNYVAEYSVQIFDKPKFRIRKTSWNKGEKYRMSSFLIKGSVATILRWTSSNPNIVEIGKNGEFFVKHTGKVKITGYYDNRKVVQTIKVKSLESSP